MEQIVLFSKTHLGRIVIVFLFAISAHIAVVIIKKLNRLFTSKISSKKAKLNSIRTLGTSIMVFIVYFIALGFMLKELGISLTAYMASASVIGLAVGFGTQGIIQDVITGITLVFSDLIDVGELVEVNGVTGIVKSINMRFIEIEDHLGAKAYIPNRTISKVVNYPKGYISCVVDYTLTDKESENKQLFESVDKLIQSVKEQNETVFRGSVSVYNDKVTCGGKKYSRIKMRIWPGRGGVIESSFKQELLSLIKDNNPDYKDWMVAVNYEVENNKAKSAHRKLKPELSNADTL